jgi:hypothetical protein
MLQGKREVIKHSAAIHIQNNITLLQRRAWNVLLANAYDELPSLERYRIKIVDLMRALEFDSKNEEYLKEALEALVSCKVRWNLLDKDGEFEWGVTTLLAEAKIKSGMCTYAYAPTLRERLHNPRMYARISLSMQNKFDSKHAQALWELCTDYLDETRNQGETPFIGLSEFKGLMGIGEAGYGGEFKILNRDVIKPSIEEINTVTDFDIRAEFKREKRKVAAVKFRVRRVEQFPGQRPRQGELFVDGKDTPLAVRELKNAGLAADEAWKIWQEGFTYVDEDKRPSKIAQAPEDAFDAYVLEKVHLLKRLQAGQKIKNVTGFLREALKRNYANPEFSLEEKKRRGREETRTKHSLLHTPPRAHAQSPERERAREAERRQLCERLVKDEPELLQEATEHVVRENPLLRKARQPGKTLLEQYREKPMLRVLVDQYLMQRFPERFQAVRDSAERQIAS